MKLSCRFIFIVVLLLCNRYLHGQETSTTYISVEIAHPDTFSHSFGWFGDEEGVYIISEPWHAEYSELTGPQWEERIYNYQPEVEYIGPDSTILVAQTGSNGADPPTNIDTTIFLFNVVEPMGIPYQSLSELTFSPNPVSDVLSFSREVINPVSIFDVNGQLINKVQFVGSELDVSQLETGLYFIQIGSGSLLRLIKE